MQILKITFKILHNSIPFTITVIRSFECLTATCSLSYVLIRAMNVCIINVWGYTEIMPHKYSRYQDEDWSTCFISNIVVCITLSLFSVLSMAIKFILYLSFKNYVLIQEMVIALLNSKHFKVVPWAFSACGVPWYANVDQNHCLCKPPFCA